MSSNNVARLSGWFAILAVVLFVAGFVLIGVNSGKETSLATTLLVISNVVSLLLFNISSVLLGVGIKRFGYLGLSNAKAPRPLAIIGIFTGSYQVVVIAFTAIPNGEVFGLGLVVLFIVWAFWLGGLFLKGKLI